MNWHGTLLTSGSTVPKFYFLSTLPLLCPGFQVRGGAHLKKLRRAEEGAKIIGVFRVKNHDFTPKNHIFSNFRGGARRVRPAPPPPGSAPANKRTLVPQPQPWNRSGTPQNRKSYVLLILYNPNSLSSVEFNVYSLIYLCINWKKYDLLA
jgi:hypothetical protein